MTGTYAGQFVMEGFMDIKLPVYLRVLITRTIAIIPALGIAFMREDQITNMDSYLNVLQSVQLPFALIPLIKFSSSYQVMGQFRISRRKTIFASLFGLLLFSMNFVIIFGKIEFSSWWVILTAITVTLFYLAFILTVIAEPTKTLQPITIEELADQEYEKVEIEDQFTVSHTVSPFPMEKVNMNSLKDSEKQ
jgi:natural resistance-associated macrophage protein